MIYSRNTPEDIDFGHNECSLLMDNIKLRISEVFLGRN